MVIAARDEASAVARFDKAYGADTPVIVRVLPKRVDRFGEGVAGFGIETADRHTVWIEP